MWNIIDNPEPRPLRPYSSSFHYVYSKRGRSLENSPSLFDWVKDEESEEQDLPSPKRRKADNRLFAKLDKDTLLRTLTLLDMGSLVKCMVVAKSLRTMILSVELRRLWSEKQVSVVLLSSFMLPCKQWLPGKSSSSASLFKPLAGPKTQLVVASHRGLVCVRLYSITNDLDLAVGNPLTGEWVALPRPLSFKELHGYRYNMEVEEPEHKDRLAAPRFKVAAFIVNYNRYFYHIFDSANGEWSITEHYFPQRITYRWSVYDLGSSTWRSDFIRHREIRTGLERNPSEVHQLPHPCHHGFFQWECKGSIYFASGWTVKQPTKDVSTVFAGYGVWKVVDASGEHLEKVAAVWGSDVGASWDAIRWNVWAKSLAVSCYAHEKLVWFGGESKLSPSMPVVFYDIDTGVWTSFNEQHPTPDGCSPNHYAAAVVYSPSLLVAPPKICRKFSSEAEKKSQQLDLDCAW